MNYDPVLSLTTSEGEPRYLSVSPSKRGAAHLLIAAGDNHIVDCLLSTEDLVALRSALAQAAMTSIINQTIDDVTDLLQKGKTT